MRILGVVFAVLLFAQSRWACAGAELLTYHEFIQLAGELAPKVDLFQEIWKQDPEAGIYAGTSRDFLYWILKQFRSAKNVREVQDIRQRLLNRDHILVREFVMRESDVDVISWQYLKIDPEVYRIHKVDMINASRLDPNTVFGQTEINQGYIPAEKIVIGRKGVRLLPQFGEGAKEIYEGRLTVHFTPTEVFQETHYAKLKINHPILLALRYLRLLAVDEYNRIGRGFSYRKIEDLMDRATEIQIQSIVKEALNGKELQPFLEKEQFRRWLNSTIRRTYRSYSNINMANYLMLHFRVNELPVYYPQIKFINNYLFAKNWDLGEIEKNMQRYEVDPTQFFTPIEQILPGRKGYHGADRSSIFENILAQGLLPSKYGNAGYGTYMVSKDDISFAINWKGGGRDVVVELTFDPATRVVDITHGEGWNVFYKFSKQHVGPNLKDDFANTFGVDILAYPYTPRAFVIKNSEVITTIEGAFRSVLTFAKALERAQNLTTSKELHQLLIDLSGSELSTNEQTNIIQSTKHAFAVSELKMLSGQITNSQSLGLLFELTRNSEDFGELMTFVRRTLPKNSFSQLLKQISFLRFTRDNLADPQFFELLQSMTESTDISVLMPFLLQRIDNPKASKMLEEILTPTHPHFAAGILGLSVAFANQNYIPWRTSNWEVMTQSVSPLAQVFISALFIQANYNYQGSLALAAQSFSQLRFNRNKNDLQTIQTLDGAGQFSMSDLSQIETAAVLESLRAVATCLVVVAPALSPLATEQALTMWSALRFRTPDAIEGLRRFDLEWMNKLGSHQRIRLAKIYVDQMLNLSIPEFPSALKPNLEQIFRIAPAAVLMVAGDDRLKSAIPFKNLVMLSVPHPDDLEPLLANVESPVGQILVALKMLEAHVAIEKAAKTIQVTFQNYSLNRKSQVRFAAGETISTEDFMLFLCRFLIALSNLPDITENIRQLVMNLPNVPKEFYDSSINVNFEALRWTVLYRQNKPSRQTVKALQRIVLDKDQSEIQRLTAARAVDLFDPTGRSAAILVRKIKKRFQKNQRRFFWQRKFDTVAFFNYDNHLHLQLLRNLNVIEPGMIDYLYMAFVDRTHSYLSTAQATSFLIELNIHEKRFEEPLIKILKKTAAKNMELYFKALVTLFPESTTAILDSLYVSHFVDDAFASYLDILVKASKTPQFLQTLVDARKLGLFPKRRQVIVEGLYLDDWIRRQLSLQSEANACAVALGA